MKAATPPRASVRWSGRQVKPIKLLGKCPSGAGPSEETRNKSVRVEFFGTNDQGEEVRARVSGGDAGYDETSKMLGECASLLVFDEETVAAF